MPDFEKKYVLFFYLLLRYWVHPWKHSSSQDEISNKNYPKIIQAIENAIKERRKTVAKCFNLQGYIPIFCVQIKGDQISAFFQPLAYVCMDWAIWEGFKR